MKKYFILLFVFCACFIASTSYAQNIRCPRHQTQTELTGKLSKTRIFRGTSKAFTEYVQGHSRGSSRVLGFVNQAEIYTKLKYNFDVQKVNGGRYCVVLNKVKGYFYAAPKLYMPKDYKKKSCEYQQILKHEKRHLNAVYKFHERNTGKYRTYLGRIARQVPVSTPVQTKEEVATAKSNIANFFESKFRELEYKSIVQLNKEQAKIDSPQEYMGVSKRCENW